MTEWNRKIFEEILAKIFPNLVKDIKLSFQKLSKTTHDQCKENHIGTWYSDCWKPKIKSWEQPEEKHLDAIRRTAEENKITPSTLNSISLKIL